MQSYLADQQLYKIEDVRNGSIAKTSISYPTNGKRPLTMMVHIPIIQACDKYIFNTVRFYHKNGMTLFVLLLEIKFRPSNNRNTPAKMLDYVPNFSKPSINCD